MLTDDGHHPHRREPFALGQAVSVPEAANLAELLEVWASARGDAACAYFVGLDNEVSVLSFAELRDRASRCAGALRLCGVRAGDRLILALSTSPDLLVAFFACQWLGVTPCIVDVPALGRGFDQWCERILPKLRLVEPQLLLTEHALVASVQIGLAHALSPQRVESVAALGSENPLSVAPSASAPALLQFTSGTTAHPKAVACSQSAVLANLRGIGGGVRQFYQGDLMVGWLPLFHDMGLVATTLAALAHGIPVTLMPAAAFVLKPVSWLRAIHAFRGSLSFAPNFAFRLCLRRLPAGCRELLGLDLSSWRIAFNAAEFIHADTARDFSERFGRHGFPAYAMTPAYGMAEMTVGVSSRPAGEPLKVDVICRTTLASEGRARAIDPGSADTLALVSLGKVFDGHELAVHDPRGQPVADRCQGEIVLRGPSLFEGYFRDPDATREVLCDGWLRTGDLGYVDHGEVYLTGRSKDVIIRAGENHHPHLLEEAASAVHGVRSGRVAAVGLPSAAVGTEEVALLVETDETSLPGQAEIRHAIEAAVQRRCGIRPDHIILVSPNVVPVTTSGKIRRGSARQMILDQLTDRGRSRSHMEGR